MENKELEIKIEKPKEEKKSELKDEVKFEETKKEENCLSSHQVVEKGSKVGSVIKERQFVETSLLGTICFCFIIISLTLGIGGLVNGFSWAYSTYITLTVFGSVCFFITGICVAGKNCSMTGEQIRKMVENESPSENLLLFTSELEQLKKEKSLYQNFFSRREELTRLDNLKNDLKEEEKEWLEVYCAARIESESSNFARQQLEKAKKKISDKISSEELEEFFNLTKLQHELENLQIQESQSESSTKVQMAQIEKELPRIK